MFFDKPEYELNLAFENVTLYSSIITINHLLLLKKKVTFKVKDIVLSSYLTITISSLTLILLLLIFTLQK